MFNYSEKTEANVSFKMNELFKTIKADKIIKADAENITAVKLSNILSPERTNLEPSETTKEIYIIDIELNSKRIPDKFIEQFNKQILFQTMFRLHYQNQLMYIVSLKDFSEEKMKILKVFETDWQSKETIEKPITTKLETVFKEMVHYIAGYKFKQDENFLDFIKRIDIIKKKKTEIEKLSKTMNAEKQPNIRMSMNDKIKQLKLELQYMEG